jgi:hypothetical protein
MNGEWRSQVATSLQSNRYESDSPRLLFSFSLFEHLVLHEKRC